MKKIIAATAAGVMLAFSGTAAHAAYEPTVETDVKTGTDGNVEAGKKERIVVRLGVPGDAGQCTGTVTLIYKNGKRVLRERDKAPGERVPFNAKVPAPTTKIIALYQRGKKDPCDKSKKVIRL
ncbi:hypothetical protein [Nocardioides sp.]|jgi:hypothetical protein|uniref:hypothetical protein n=1 Tax=Nocardioides sp. TaxID=35761 RepID=UPI002629275B|nr:hypothetical protein [Nocardioides sp.]